MSGAASAPRAMALPVHPVAPAMARAMSVMSDHAREAWRAGMVGEPGHPARAMSVMSHALDDGADPGGERRERERVPAVEQRRAAGLDQLRGGDCVTAGVRQAADRQLAQP